MKILKSNLLKALETVKPGLSTNEIIEQSTHFCFLKGNLVTYNDEISISYPLEDMKLEGAVSAKEFYNFVSKATDKEISIEKVENQIILRSGKSKAGLNIQAEVVLPLQEIGDKITKWKTLPKNFTKGLLFSMASCSRDTSKPVLMCVHINGKFLESSDNYRISQYILDEEMDIEKSLIRSDYCRSIIQFKPTGIAEGKGWIHFINEDKALMSCRILEDAFVNIKPLLKIEGEKLNLPTEILDIIDRATSFAKKEHFIDEAVTIKIEGNKLTLRTESESGWFEEKCVFKETSGNDITFVIIPYLLKDILKETTHGLINDRFLCFESKNWKYISMLRGK
jgi:DNA polymerase III sliding clamp (beta) subunit (PCNA family)